ncbi:MAG: hypothetical protein Kow00109_06030 [Acidobacteriota bacterium]
MRCLPGPARLESLQVARARAKAGHPAVACAKPWSAEPSGSEVPPCVGESKIEDRKWEIGVHGSDWGIGYGEGLKSKV